MHFFEQTLFSPLGNLCITTSEVALISITLVDAKTIREAFKQPDIMQFAKQQLAGYFAGSLKNFTLPMHLIGTPLMQKVWEGLQSIPYGSTCSYKQIAEKIGKPLAIRAVATAIGKTPCPIVIPCHRVIGSNGSLTGYAWGLLRKQYLLDHEAGMLLKALVL